MKEQSLIFKAWGMRAILNMQPGVWPAEAIDPSKPIKCQTRRIIKPQPVLHPEADHFLIRDPLDPLQWMATFGAYRGDEDVLLLDGLQGPWKSPKGIEGGVVWCRETCRANMDDDSAQCGVEYKADGKLGRRMMAPDPIWSKAWVYRGGPDGKQNERGNYVGLWIPSIHMRRELSRCDLQIMRVRAERIQDITADDARLEGISQSTEYPFENGEISCPSCGGAGVHGAFGTDYGVTEVDCTDCDGLRKRFRNVWDEINASMKPAKRNPFTGQPEECMCCYPWSAVREQTTIKGKVYYTVGNPFVFAYDLMRMKGGAK
jgi:hypothetical protein